ncbi:MAG: hypothetical protein JST40_14375 [Armatimonadetes bacterium]|nr:hypothetical protein [Armatimonadota bacterium]
MSGLMANASMGFGLERWVTSYWAIYVVLTVAVEAWLIGRRRNLPWVQRVVRAVGANALTMFFGAQLCSVFLHSSFAGPRLNPNPLLDSVVLLSIFAIPSALIEAPFWGSKQKGRDLLYIVAVHLLVVPVGLAIVLIPPRPYPGLEAISEGARRFELTRLMERVEEYAHTHDALPDTRSMEALLDAIGEPRSKMVCFYEPRYERFATKENFSKLTFRLNPDLAGYRLLPNSDGDKLIPILVPIAGQKFAPTYLFNPLTGDINRSVRR